MSYYNFLLNMWVMNRITEQQLQTAVTKEYITQQEADEIKTHQQVSVVG